MQEQAHILGTLAHQVNSITDLLALCQSLNLSQIIVDYSVQPM